jgi:iron-sulfur cluster biosynthesis transcriptional regulator SufR
MIETKKLAPTTNTRERVLHLLKLKGSMTADQIADELGITSMGVRRHLITMERDGLLQYRVKQRGQGRPGFVYSLTERGDEFFPRTYPQWANSLLDTVRALDGDKGVERLFDKRTEELSRQYRQRLLGKNLQEKVTELAKIRSEEGYMADWEALDEKTFVLREHNCAICLIAKQYQSACSHELDLFKKALTDADVIREEHIVKGDKMCTYLIQAKASTKTRAKTTQH